MISNTDFLLGNYHHYCSVFDENGYDSYLDGIHIGRNNFTVDTDGYKNLSSIQINEHSACNVNAHDFRVYDHCLSQKEVRDLAQAKIFHYKFNESSYWGNNLFSN
jgi:hypothetical protein